VEWHALWDPTASPATQMALMENPLLRLLSARDPLSDTLGFDGGMLAPGRVYPQEGTYTYHDGLGHTATVVVATAEKRSVLIC